MSLVPITLSINYLFHLRYHCSLSLWYTYHSFFSFFLSSITSIFYIPSFLPSVSFSFWFMVTDVLVNRPSPRPYFSSYAFFTSLCWPFSIYSVTLGVPWSLSVNCFYVYILYLLFLNRHFILIFIHWWSTRRNICTYLQFLLYLFNKYILKI